MGWNETANGVSCFNAERFCHSLTACHQSRRAVAFLLLLQHGRQCRCGISFLVFFVLLGCAAVGPPPGGPLDKTPPSLIDTAPPSGTTRIDPGFSVTLTFSERLDESALENGFRVAPALNDPLKISMKKEKLIITFPEDMAENQTYVLTVTRDIMDERRNRLDQTYQLAFSTGGEISKGRIGGTVYSPDASSSTVYLYKADSKELDSLFTQAPDYYIETNDSGQYSFSYLEPGQYQVLAFQGGRSPMPISPSRMPYGVHWEAPIHVENPQDTIRHVDIRISREVPPLNVLKVQMETSHRGVVRFTNSVKLSEQDSISVLLVEQESGQAVDPDYVFQYRDGSSELRFHSGRLLSGQRYTVAIANVRDSVDQWLSEFSGSVFIPEADSVGPAVIFPEVGKKVILEPGFDPLEVQFNDMTQIDTAAQAVVLRDTSAQEVDARVQWSNPTRLQVVPQKGWQSEELYELVLYGRLIQTPEGIGMPDSALVLEIEVAPEIGHGGLFGYVNGRYAEGSIVTANSVEKPSISYSTAVNLQGGFSFQELPAGFWTLHAYQDRDGNRRYSYGRAVPFQPAEPFLVLPDTLEVRAKWDVEGIQLEYAQH